MQTMVEAGARRMGEIEASLEDERPSRLLPIAMRALSLGGFLGLWAAASLLNLRYQWVRPLLLPSPWDVFLELVRFAANGELIAHIGASLSRVMWGFLFGALAAVSLGMLVGRVRMFRWLVEPVLELLRPIPPLALLPVMVIWFGIGESSKIIFIVYTAFFPMFVTTVESVAYVDPLLIQAASSLGATRKQLFRFVVLPAALPGIITGLRLGFGLALFVIVAAEYIAANQGLGYLINDGRNFFLLPQMLMAAFVVGALGYLFSAALKKLEGRLLRWREA